MFVYVFSYGLYDFIMCLHCFAYVCVWLSYVLCMMFRMSFVRFSSGLCMIFFCVRMIFNWISMISFACCMILQRVCMICRCFRMIFVCFCFFLCLRMIPYELCMSVSYVFVWFSYVLLQIFLCLHLLSYIVCMFFFHKKLYMLFNVFCIVFLSVYYDLLMFAYDFRMCAYDFLNMCFLWFCYACLHAFSNVFVWLSNVAIGLSMLLFVCDVCVWFPFV